MNLDIDELLKNKLFQSVDKSKLYNVNLEGKIYQKKFNKGKIIVEQGAKANKLCLIKKGTVKVTKDVSKDKKVTVNRLFQGDFFGELGILLPNNRRTARVVAEEKTVLFIIKKENLFEIIDECKQIENNLYRNIARIIEKSDKKVLSKKIQEDVILDLYENIQNSKNNDSSEVKHRFTVEKKDKYIVIQEKEIFYFSSDKNYSFIHVFDKNYFYNRSLKKLQNILDSERFMRIHRKYIISCDKVKQIKKEGPREFYVILKDKNETKLKVGRTYIKNLKSKFDL